MVFHTRIIRIYNAIVSSVMSRCCRISITSVRIIAKMHIDGDSQQTSRHAAHVRADHNNDFNSHTRLLKMTKTGRNKQYRQMALSISTLVEFRWRSLARKCMWLCWCSDFWVCSMCGLACAFTNWCRFRLGKNIQYRQRDMLPDVYHCRLYVYNSATPSGDTANCCRWAPFSTVGIYTRAHIRCAVRRFMTAAIQTALRHPHYTHMYITCFQ